LFPVQECVVGVFKEFILLRDYWVEWKWKKRFRIKKTMENFLE